MCVQNECKAWVNLQKKKMLVFMEIKMREHSKITKDHDFHAHVQQANEGVFGEIIIMGKQKNLIWIIVL